MTERHTARTWRDVVRGRLDSLGLADQARTVRHWVRSRGGRTDDQLIADHLATVSAPRLHLGCGTRLLDGWLNSDFSPRTTGSIRIDATQPLPFATDTFAYVYSEHMIEHIDRLDGERLLAEVCRVLRPEGRLRIATPDLGRLLALFRPAEEYTGDEQRYIDEIAKDHLPGVEPGAATAVQILNNNVREWGHQYLYDAASFEAALARAGFGQIEQFELQESNDAELAGLANAGRMLDGLVAFETMTFEAVAP